MGNGKSLGADVGKALVGALAKPPGSAIKYPILLTPRSPFLTGIAALVFASAHVVSPADDVAEFGAQPALGEEGGKGVDPYDGARVVAWFRPPELSRTYDIVFECRARYLASFNVETSDGGMETVQVTGASDNVYTASQNVSLTFDVQSHDWRWFSISSDAYWRLLSCQISPLP